MAKRSARPLVCKLCGKEVPPNETWKHLEAEHKEQKGGIKGLSVSIMVFYEGGTERMLTGAIKSQHRQRQRY